MVIYQSKIVDQPGNQSCSYNNYKGRYEIKWDNIYKAMITA